MLHYTCDRCQRSINTEEGPRYIVHIDIDVVADEDGAETDELGPYEIDDESVDYLSDLNEKLETEAYRAPNFDDEEQGLDFLHELLSRGDDHGLAEQGLEDQGLNEDSSSDAHRENEPPALPNSFDLCQACYEKYARNPLGQDRALKLQFSNN